MATVSATTKKKEERRFVETLRDQLDGFPKGELIQSESPDVVIAAPDGPIGIEVTKIHRASTLYHSRQQESECRARVNQALQIYKSKSAIPLEVKVHFGGNSEFKKRNRKHFAQALANIVMSHVPEPDSWVVVQNDLENPSRFPYEIDSISIIRLSALQESFWSVPSAGFVQEDFVPEMEAIIVRKEQSLAAYNSDCIAYWLLIVAEGNSASTFFDPSPATLQHCYCSSFTRIFFLESFRRKIWELTASKHATFKS